MNGDSFDARLRSPNGHRIMEGIGPRIKTGLLLESSCELPTGLASRKQSSSGRVLGPQSVADSVSRSCQIQKRFVGVTDQNRLKVVESFLLPGNSLLHPLRTPQNHHLSVVLSSPDRLHRVLRIRNQNRGTNRNGSIDEETSDVSVHSRSNRVATCISSLNSKPRGKPSR